MPLIDLPWRKHFRERVITEISSFSYFFYFHRFHKWPLQWTKCLALTVRVRIVNHYCNNCYFFYYNQMTTLYTHNSLIWPYIYLTTSSCQTQGKKSTCCSSLLALRSTIFWSVTKATNKSRVKGNALECLWNMPQHIRWTSMPFLMDWWTWTVLNQYPLSLDLV